MAALPIRRAEYTSSCNTRSCTDLHPLLQGPDNTRYDAMLKYLALQNLETIKPPTAAVRNQTASRFFQPFCTAHLRVPSGKPRHIPSAKNCSFAWAHVNPHIIQGSFSPPEPTVLWNNCANMAYHYIIPLCLHHYTTTLYLVP